MIYYISAAKCGGKDALNDFKMNNNRDHKLWFLFLLFNSSKDLKNNNKAFSH